jgi:hypothetical protein
MLNDSMRDWVSVRVVGGGEVWDFNNPREVPLSWSSAETRNDSDVI